MLSLGIRSIYYNRIYGHDLWSSAVDRTSIDNVETERHRRTVFGIVWIVII